MAYVAAGDTRLHRRLPRARVRLAVAAGILGFLSAATYFAGAAFSPSQPAVQAAGSGLMSIELGSAGSADNRLTIGATLTPGNHIERQVRLSVDNVGDPMDAITLTTSGTNGPPAMITDADEGLKVWISRCSIPFEEWGDSPDFSYTCNGDQYDVLGMAAVPVPILQTDATLANLDLADGADNYLRINIELPQDVSANVLNQSSDVTFTFNGIQRDGTYK